MNSAIQLPAVLAIGFTGHRSLADEAMCRKLICDVLLEYKSASTIVYGVSSVAAGSDLLFAESCLALNIPLRVVLPLSQEEFAKDFDPSNWERAMQVMHSALSVEIIGSNNELREERYYECGLETVQQSQILIAVWNGNPAQGLGGTEEVIEYAKHIGRPVVWIHSVTGEIQTFHRSLLPIEADPELTFLNRLPSLRVSPVGQSPLALAEGWLAKLDANAVRAAPQVRRMAAWPIVLTAMAAFISGAAPRLRPHGAWVAIGGGLGLVAAMLSLLLGLQKRQARWVRIRTAAEVSRSVLALWGTPSRYQVVGPEILPELSIMLLSLNFLKSQGARINVVTIHQFKTQYLEKRLLHQKEYFLRQSLQAARKAHRFRLVNKFCVVSAVLLSAWVVVRPYVRMGHAASKGQWLSLAAAALFQVATVAGALVVVHDCDRRQRRYREIHRALAAWETELQALHTWHPVTQAVGRIERALLVELIEWRSLLQNMKMPRN